MRHVVLQQTPEGESVAYREIFLQIATSLIYKSDMMEL